MKKSILTAYVFMFCLLLPAVSAEDNAGRIVGQADKNFSNGSFIFYTDFIVCRPGEKDINYSMKNYIKGKDKMLIIFTAPPRVQDQALLRKGDDQWIYFPDIKKTMKISGRQQLLGSDFLYGDILSLDLSNGYKASIVDDTAEVNGDICYKINLSSTSLTALYDKVTYYIRKDDYAPIKREFYTKSGIKLKTLILNNHDIDHIPRRWEMFSALQKGSSTIMLIKSIKKKDIPDNYFSLEYLRRGR